MSVLVSYLVFAYNHENFIEAALESALDQTYEPMEILVTDDCSTDRTAELIEQQIANYRGRKAISFRRNATNLGLAGVINTVAADAKGELLVAAAGDDISFSRRTEATVRAFSAAPDIQFIWSNALKIDENGATIEPFYKVPPHARTLRSFEDPSKGLLGATAAYRRDVFDAFEPLAGRQLWEDRVLPLRGAILGRGAYVDETLVGWRQHDENLSGFDTAAGADVESWYTFLKRTNDMMICVLEQRLSDINTGIRLVPDKRAELIRLQQATATHLMRAQAEDRLLRMPGLLTKTLVTAQVLASGVDRRFVRRWISKFFFPKRFFEKRRRKGRLGAYSWQNVRRDAQGVDATDSMGR